MTLMVLDVLRSAFRESETGDVVHLHDPELIPAGVLLKLSGRKVVYDAHEHVARDIFSKPWLPAVLKPPISIGIALVERLAVAMFDAVVCATPAILRSQPQSKSSLVQNYSWTQELLPLDGTVREPDGRSFLFVGGLAKVRNARQMVEAIGRLPATLDARLILAGIFTPPELEQELRLLPGWNRVDYRGWIDRRAFAVLAARSVAGLVLYSPTVYHLESQPTKLFEYMSAGLPVIASDFPLWRRIVEEAKCGLLVNPNDAGQIGDALQWMIEHPGEASTMGQNGARAVQSTFNWENEAKELVRLYRKLMANPAESG